jgi:hypothetical protein
LPLRAASLSWSRDADLRILRRRRVTRPRVRGRRRFFWRRRYRTEVWIALLAGLALCLVGWQVPAMRSAPSESIAESRRLDGLSVIDGDTYRLGGKSIRLGGIDAPERTQTRDGWSAGEAALQRTW